MQTIKQIKEKYLFCGVKEDNIDFAITSVNEGNKREHIIESLTAEYRGMSKEQSNRLLDELYEAVGGEFKKENNSGYANGATLLIIGLFGAGFLFAMIYGGEWKLKYLILAAIAAFFGLTNGLRALTKAMKGKYRDSDDVFESP